MEDNFEKAVLYVLGNEGGFINDPNDSGKATKYGITIAMLASSRGAAVTADDVKNLSSDEAKSIYKKYFWDQMKLDRLPLPHATAIMDMAVNMGEGSAVKCAQGAVNATQDGNLGSQSVTAILHLDPHDFFYAFVFGIQEHYIEIVIADPKNIRFLKGWLRRALKLFTLIENL